MKDADVRDDVFALGVMWHQLLLGDLTLERPAGKWRKRVADLRLDAAVLDLLEACVDDDPQERPADGHALAERLQAIQDEPVAVVPVARPVAPPPPVSRPRPPVKEQTAAPGGGVAVGLLLAVLLAVVLVGGIWWANFGGRPADPSSPVVNQPDPKKSSNPPRDKGPDKIPGDKEPPLHVTNSVDMKFRWIPPGTFLMGSPPGEANRFDNERQFRVKLTKGFYMGVTPVTQGQWRAVMGDNPSTFKNGDNYPVEMVFWNRCKDFLKQLQAKTQDGREYRLPTEAEFEYASRAGTQTAYFFGNDANQLGAYAWYFANSNNSTQLVGTKQPNPWGLYDMAGNVWQWCEDYYGPYPEMDIGDLNKYISDPKGIKSEDARVLRGGSWVGNPGGCRSAARIRSAPGDRSDIIGFRVCFRLD